jgi:hypothetical protein
MKNRNITPLNGQDKTTDVNKPQLTWFQLMWKNWYIQLFATAIIFILGELYVNFFVEPFYSIGGVIVGFGIPIGMMIMIAYKGFYQFWNDYTHGRSR